DGTVSIAQPLIEPLYQGRSAHELVTVLAGRPQTPGSEIVRAHWLKHWQGQKTAGDFEDFWQTALHDGVVPGTRFPTRSDPLKAGWEKHLQGGSEARAVEGYE